MARWLPKIRNGPPDIPSNPRRLTTDPCNKVTPSSTTLRGEPGSQNRLSTSTLTKEEIFRAVARAAVASLLEALESTAEGPDAPFAELAPKLLSRVAGMMTGGRVPAIARMVIGESRNFPDLARIWHDDVVASVIGLVAGIIARARAHGEVAHGDPRFHAFSLMGPMLWPCCFARSSAGSAPIHLICGRSPTITLARHCAAC
jgi:hypothetical protein